MFSNQYEHTVEWGDCDPAGIVFYPRFFAFFDAATAALFAVASGVTRAEFIAQNALMGWPMLDTRAIFKKAVSFDDEVVIDSRVTRLGRTSIDIEHRLYCKTHLCVEATEIRAFTIRDPDTGALCATPIPQLLRKQLQK